MQACVTARRLVARWYRRAVPGNTRAGEPCSRTARQARGGQDRGASVVPAAERDPLKLARDLLLLDPGFQARVADALLAQSGDARSLHSVALAGVPLIRPGMTQRTLPPITTPGTPACQGEEESCPDQ
jgi:hypothetical protein